MHCSPANKSMGMQMDTDNGGNLQVGKLTEVFFKIKAQRETLKQEFDAEDSVLERKQSKIKAVLLDHLKSTGQKSGKTDAGTFYRTVKQKYWTSDWESMHEFILENKVPEFLDKRLNQKNVREYLEENPDKLPKGLNSDSEYVLTIRKSK